MWALLLGCCRCVAAHKQAAAQHCYVWHATVLLSIQQRPGCVLRTQCSRFAAVLEQTRRSTASTGLLLLLLPVKLLLSSEQSSLCFDDQAEAQLLLATTHAGTLICREVSCLLASAIHLMLPAGCWLPLAAAALCEQGACLQKTHKLTDSLSPYSSLSTESCRKRFSCNMG